MSLSTIERFVRLVRKEDPIPQGKEMHRYERAHINEVWYGDTCFGPYLSTPEGKKRVYFMALIDDASRFIVAADIFFNDNYENLMALIRSAVLKHGIPHLFSFDNGSSYRNQQMELLAARIGSSVHYYEPFTPTSKSKIERWFLTMRMHEPLRQRIVMNYNMGGLTKDEGHAYITRKLEGAGCRQKAFEKNAAEAVLNAANGTPRMINKICNRSLMIGASKNLNSIDADIVMKAVDDIQLG